MNSIKLYLAIPCLFAGMLTFAEDSATPAATEKSIATAEARLAKLGGYVIYPESQKGLVSFIDTQSAVDVSGDFDEVIGHFRRQVPVRIEVTKGAAGEPGALKRSAKANFAVVFVSDDKAPPTVVVPEEGYAVVNFAKYTAGLKLPADEAKYKRRCVRAALKAFVLLCGGGGSRYPGHVAAAHTPQELDFAQDKLPIDIQDSVKKYLGAAGVTPMKRTVYRKACEEGWAPAPTNDVQKAIWDKVHAMPTEPIKIKPEEKKTEK